MVEGSSGFGGSVPRAYQRYLVPLIFEDYARDLAGRVTVPPDGAVLETACGTGVVTRHLRAVLAPTVRIVATDLNAAMLAVAEAEAPAGSGVEYQPADATALSFDDATFDAVLCQFGAMFFPDRGRGYREAARVLKPGGTFLFSVWDALTYNPAVACVHDTMATLAPDDPPMFLAVPYGYHDLSAIKIELQEAGFGEIDFLVLPREGRAPTVRDAALAFVAGTPLALQLAERGVAEAALPAVEAAFRARFGPGPVRAPMQAIVIVARTPSCF